MATFRLVNATTATNPNLHDLYLDDVGDFEWIGGDITDQEDYSRMILQRIKCRLLSWRGDWYLDQRQGTPWREQVMIKAPSISTIRRVVREVVLGTPGVERISSLDIELDSQSRTATIEIVVVADTGTIITTAQLDEPLIIEVQK